MTLRCAVYGRYSTDKQNPLSTEDQIRACREFAERQDWAVLGEHVYRDEAISGTTDDRPGLRALMQAALSPSRPFDVILIDDTSRLTRDLGDAIRIYQRLNFAGVRLIAVAQGIDSQSEQADVLVTVHGLVDSLYIRELGRKTHRGLDGLVLRGFHAGGRCFGYQNVQTPEGVRLEVDDREAVIVRRIFEMSAAGHSLRKIARTLNEDRVSPPRPRAGRQYASWCPTAIREMLRRELYCGRVIWNRSRFERNPETRKRVRRPKPESQWRRVERPDLRIVSDELWERVHARLAWVKEAFGHRGKEGLLRRSVSSRYLLSGFLQCGMCGADLAIVTGRTKGHHPRYGCPQNFYRGTCANGLKERQDRLEDRLLGGLQAEVLQPEVIEYAIQEFGRQLKAALGSVLGTVARMRERKATIEGELRRLTAAVAESGHSTFLLQAITDGEREVREITAWLLSGGPGSVEAELGEIRRFVTERLADIRGLLYTDVALARTELGKHLSKVRMIPQQVGAVGCYVAEGQWNLLGGYPKTDRARHLLDERARLVAGAGFEPATFGL